MYYSQHKHQSVAQQAPIRTEPVQYAALPSCDLALQTVEQWPLVMRLIYPPLGIRCLSLSRLLASQGRAFSLKLTIGHQFSFCVDSKGMRWLPARGSPDGNLTRKKAPLQSGVTDGGGMNF